ncbi:MAG: hypothetical protein AABX71_00145 [Nanoarchaeota archaeon]
MDRIYTGTATQSRRGEQLRFLQDRAYTLEQELKKYGSMKPTAPVLVMSSTLEKELMEIKQQLRKLQ